MLSLRNIKRVLTISAHPDDVELSCGGSLLKLKKEYNVDISQIICSSGELKNKSKSRRSEQIKANRFLKASDCIFLDYSDGDIQFNNHLVADLEKNITNFSPDLIFTHLSTDIHQDHRNVGLATKSACRRVKTNLLEYPSLFTREIVVENFFIDITKYFENKLTLLSIFKSQKVNEYMDEKTIEVRAREAGLLNRSVYAEKFLLSYGFM